MASQEIFASSVVYRIPSDMSSIQPHYIPSVIHASYEPVSSSVADSDSVASFSESDQGSQQSDQQSTSSWKSTKSRNNIPADKEVRAVHNVSEQHRRKYLKSCFENLQREVVSESSSKVSHLVILTSALEAITMVRNQESNIRREQERISLEFRLLKSRFDEVTSDLVQGDPNFNVHQVLDQSGLGPVETFSPALFERLDRFRTEDVIQQVTSGQREFPEEGTKRPAKIPSSQPATKRNSKKVKIKSGDVSSGASVESLDGDAEVNSEGDRQGLNGTAKEDHPIFLRLLDDIEDNIAEELSLPQQKKPLLYHEPAKPISIIERRKLAAEKGLPLHLAYGIPTLPGGNYWSQSISAFPSFSPRFRSSFSRRRLNMVASDSTKLPPSLQPAVKNLPLLPKPEVEQSKTAPVEDVV